MQRGRAEQQIALLGPDGRPAPDTLYRPPVELWDRTMRHLTILLDPGRLKRGVGPNRKLGPPLKAGHKYTLAITPLMIDCFGRSIREGFYKSFHVTEAVRQPIAVEQWTILRPAKKSHQSLVLLSPNRWIGRCFGARSALRRKVDNRWTVGLTLISAKDDGGLARHRLGLQSCITFVLRRVLKMSAAIAY